MISTEAFKAIAELDLDPIKVKLMHEESGEGWTLEQADAVEVEYRRFLYLMKMFPHEQAAPLVDVDIFWHYHILDTLKYAQDCEAVFGFFLHHFPYIGLRGEDDLQAHHRMGARMQELYEATFGDSYEPVQAGKDGRRVAGATPSSAYSAAAVATAYSAAAVQTAYSAAAVQTAYSAAAVQTAYSAAATKLAAAAGAARPSASDARMFSVRPRLAA